MKNITREEKETKIDRKHFIYLLRNKKIFGASLEDYKELKFDGDTESNKYIY